MFAILGSRGVHPGLFNLVRWLANAFQASPVPQSDGNSAQGGRGGQQQTSPPDPPGPPLGSFAAEAGFSLKLFILRLHGLHRLHSRIIRGRAGVGE